MKKKLSELEPRIGINRLRFNCPACAVQHWISIPFNKAGQLDLGSPIWEKTGNTVEGITITPSIDGTALGECKFHGHVTNGEVIWSLDAS